MQSMDSPWEEAGAVVQDVARSRLPKASKTSPPPKERGGEPPVTRNVP